MRVTSFTLFLLLHRLIAFNQKAPSLVMSLEQGLHTCPLFGIAAASTGEVRGPFLWRGAFHRPGKDLPIGTRLSWHSRSAPARGLHNTQTKKRREKCHQRSVSHPRVGARLNHR